MLKIVGSVKVSAPITTAHPQWLNQPVYRRVLFRPSICPAGERQIQTPESASGHRKVVALQEVHHQLSAHVTLRRRQRPLVHT